MSTPRYVISLDEAVAALRADLIHEDGPRISTMRNYRFAILPYDPEDEFVLHQQINSLTNELQANGWVVLTIDLQKLLLDRIRSMGDEAVEAIMARERRLFDRSKGNPERSLNYLKEKIAQHVEGRDGIAGDVSKIITAFARANPEKAERTVAFIGRTGALYPFFRGSALLKHLDGRTENVPVVLLYPGARKDSGALSFMGELPADRDYRPRIYP